MALGELNCPSLDYVYRMTWAEFKLRLIAFNRTETRQMYKLRRLAWVTFIAPYQDPKKLRGMNEKKFMPLEGENPKKASKEIKQRFLEEYKKYLDKVNNGRA